MKDLNNCIFDLLDEYLPIIPVGAEEGPHLVTLHPPGSVQLNQFAVNVRAVFDCDIHFHRHLLPK